MFKGFRLSPKHSKQLLCILAGLSLAQPVHAFPFAAGPLSQVLVNLALSGTLFLVASRKKIALSTITLLIFGFAIMSGLYMEKEHLTISGQGKVHSPVTSRFTGSFDWREKLISAQEARELDRTSFVKHVTISAVPQPYIDGLPLFYVRDFDRIRSHILADERPEAVIFYTRQIAQAFNLIQSLHNMRIEFRVVDLVSPVSIPEFLDRQIGGLSRTLAEPPTAFYESRFNMLQDYQTVTLINESWAENNFPMHTHLLLLSDLIIGRGPRIDAIINDHKQRPVYLFTADIGREHSKLSAQYLKSLLPSSRKLTTSLLVTENQGLFSLPNDNFITPPYRLGTNRVDPTSLYAFINAGRSATVICFSDNCERWFPSQSEALNVETLNEDGLLAYRDTLTLLMDQIPRDRTIFLAPEDAATTYISMALGYELIQRGYPYGGFLSHFSQYFGSAKTVSSTTGEHVISNDVRIQIITSMKEMVYRLSPEKPFILDGLILVLLFVLISQLYRFGTFTSVVALLATSIIMFNFDQWFRLPVGAYSQYAFNPLALIGLSALMLVLQYRDKTTKYRLVIIALGTLLSALAHQYIMPPMDRMISGFLIGLILIELGRQLYLWSCHRSRFFLPKQVSVLGSKARYTANHVRPNQYGWILKGDELPTQFPWHLRIRAQKWILRSNHLSALESGAAGMFESRVVKSSSLIETAKELTSRAAQQGLQDHQIQFWLQPFRSFPQTGVAASHADDSETEFRLSIGQPGEATSGKSCRYEQRTRLPKVLSGHAGKVYKLLSRMEASHNGPVVLEFGITVFGRVRLLQVRPQRLPPYFDPHNCGTIRKGIDKSVEVAHHPYPLMSQSVLSRLYDDELFFDGDRVFRRCHGRPLPFEMGVALRVQQELMELHDDIEKSSLSIGANEVINVLHGLMSEPLKMGKSGSERLSNAELDRFKHGLEKAISQGLILSDHLDVTSSPDLSASYDRLQNTSAMEREIVHYLVAMSVGICRKVLENHQQLKPNQVVNGSMSEDRHTRPEKHNGHDQSFAVVTGDLPEKRVSWDDYVSLSAKEKGLVTLTAPFLDDSQIALVPYAGGVLTAYGNPLSHLSLTCRYYQIPYRIDEREFKGRSSPDIIHGK